MTISEIVVAPPLAAAIAKAMRLATTLLSLAGVSVLVVVLRVGVYEYFHGEGRVLTSVWAALHR
jgi:hypothetical protein